MRRHSTKFHFARGQSDPDTPPGLGGRLAGTLFFGIFFVLGLFFTVMVAREVRFGAETLTWPEQRCEVLAGEVVRGAGERPYQPRVRFEVVGRELSGGGARSLRRDDPSFSTWDEAADQIASFAPGSRVPCYVSKAGEAVLRRGPLWLALGIPFSLIFVAVGAIGLVASWQTARRDALGQVALEPLAEKARPMGNGSALARTGAAVMLAGLVIAWLVALRPLSNVIDARSWITQRCQVEHSSVVAHPGDKGTTYRVDILYRWDRGRGVERSSRYSFYSGSSSGRSAKAEIVRAYPVGADVSCWVDPHETNEAVLERGVTSQAWLGILPGVFLVGGVSLWRFGRRRVRQHERLRERARVGHLPFRHDDPIFAALPRFEHADGPVELLASSTRWGRLAGVVFATLFWNGIVGIFVREAWRGYDQGDPEPFLMVFLIPFVLVGIGLVVGVAYALIALANPRPRLITSSAQPCLGDSVRIQWRLEGRVGAVERLQIILKGLEQATYQVGTDTRTATEEFHLETLVDCPGSTASTTGEAICTIPADSMHSFKSAHHEIAWEILVKGQVRGRPDISETYRLVVLPRAVNTIHEEATRC